MSVEETVPNFRSVKAAHAVHRVVTRQRRAQTWRGLLLVGPLFAFTVILFGYPLVRMAWYSVASPEIADTLPNLERAITAWDGKGLPPDRVFAAAVGDLRAAAENRTVFRVAARLNNEWYGMFSLIMGTATHLERLDTLPPKSAARVTMIGLDQRWSEERTWRIIRRATHPLTPHYLLTAVDLKWTLDRGVVPVDPDHAVFTRILLRTIWMALVVTVYTLVIGFPIAHLLATTSARWRNLILIPVLLPFWTALLVRVYAWIVLLQKEGIINTMLVSMDVVAKPIQMVFDRTGVYIAMVHVLLPLMVLPLYSVMRGISPVYMRAAASLGARPVRAFLSAYLPQVAPGIGAGCTLVFMTSIGYYVTPALVGSPQDQMMGYYIAFYTNESANWGLASALALVLLFVTVLLYFVCHGFLKAAPRRSV